MSKYCYVYTGDKNNEERLKRINRAIEAVKNLNEEVIFAVNDLQSISYLKDRGYKALNIDAAQDLFNLLTPDDSLLICTPEDVTYIKASYNNVKEICDE